MAHIEDRWQDKDKNPTARHGKGKRWRVRYSDPSGAEKGKSFEKKADAENFLTGVKGDILRGTYVDPDAGKVTLRKYGAEWLETLAVEATTRERVGQRLRVHVYPVLGGKTLGQLAQRPSLIKAWLAGLDVAPSHAQGILANLSSILSAAVDDGLIIRNPCSVRSVKKPKVVRRKLVPWEAVRVAAVRAALPARYRALADLGSGLGLRQGEAFGLSPSDVDWLRGKVIIRRQVRIVKWKLCFAPPKGGKEREVPLPGSVKDRLAAHLAEFPAIPVTLPWKEPDGKPVTASLCFTTTARKALDRSYFHRLWRTARSKAGVSNDRENGFHALRHHYASVLLAGGEDINKVSEYLGHHDPAFTLRTYVHLMPGHEDTARKIIDAALEPVLAEDDESGEEAQ